MLHPSLQANWSGPVADFNTGDSSCFTTTLSKSLIITLVKKIALSLLHVSKGVSFGIGVLLASFHKQGTNCFLREELNTFVIVGASSLA